jgi:MFS family permease
MQLTRLSTYQALSRLPVDQRNFAAGLWHGAFLAMGVSMTDPTTVISSLVVDLTGSTVWVGGLATILTVAGALPQLFVARWVEPRPRKMPFLLAAIYLRVISWAVLAYAIFAVGASQTMALAWLLVGMLVIFYAGGGLGNIPYTDIIGKIIPPDQRGAYFGGMGALAGPLSLGAALTAKQILARVSYPNNYALLFGLAAASLATASLGFWMMKEPAAKNTVVRATNSWYEYWHHLQSAGKRLKTLIAAQLLTGFSLMVLPFYVVYAREVIDAPVSAVGWFLLAQISGSVLFNLIWARLVDHSSSRRMLTFCAIIAAVTPLLAIALGTFGWLAMLPVFFLVGATVAGRKVGFQSALLELAPAAKRSTYAALNAVLILPVAFLSLAAGLFLQHFSYAALFVLASTFISLGAVVIHRWAAKS